MRTRNLVRNLIMSAGVAALTLGTASAQTTETRTTRTTTVHHSTATTPHRTVYRSRVRHPVHHSHAARRSSDDTTTTTTTTSTQLDANPEREYRDGPQYQERTLSSSDRVYAGDDGRYYCKRSDGTTGLIVGGVAGGVLGKVLTSGKSSTLGTLLGAAGGALAGRAVDKGVSTRNEDVRCR